MERAHLYSENSKGIVGIHDRMDAKVNHSKPNTHGGTKGGKSEQRDGDNSGEEGTRQT